LFPALAGALALLVQTPGVRGQGPPDEATVAIVEGRKISYKEIRMPKESLRLEYRLKYGKYPESGPELGTLALLSEKTEKERLRGRIESIIHQKQIERLGIVVTDVELVNRQRELFAKIDLDAELAKGREKLLPLIQALKAVMGNDSEEKRLYETYLSKLMSYEEWLVHKQYYHSAQRIAMLENFANITPEGYRKATEIRALVANEKLDLEIDADLARTDQEFAAYNQARRSKDVETMQRIEKRNPFYLQAKRAEWWRHQYAKADIQILDKKYLDVLQNLRNLKAGSAPATNNPVRDFSKNPPLD
jgi:hypothetical protein